MPPKSTTGIPNPKFFQSGIRNLNFFGRILDLDFGPLCSSSACEATLAQILGLDLKRYVAVLYVQILDLEFGIFGFCMMGHVWGPA